MIDFNNKSVLIGSKPKIVNLLNEKKEVFIEEKLNLIF